jgi:curved DNA-binding protein CbpA
VDPHDVLGLDRGASAEEIQRAYRELAKRFHPDRAGEGGGELMASINAAYDLLRDELTGAHGGRVAGRHGSANGGPRSNGGASAGHTPASGARRQGDWLPPAVSRVLARELLAVLERSEQVHEVLLTSTADSHEVQLAITDRRLLWLRDDAIVGRVRSLRYRDVAEVDGRTRGRWRRSAELRVRLRNGRRLRFFELRPDVVARVVPAIAGRVAG